MSPHEDRIMVEKQLKLKATNARPEILDALKTVCGSYWEQRLENTARFLDHLWMNTQSSIASIVCGGGKTLWSYAVILNHWQQSNKGNPLPPLYLVVDNLTTGSERLEYLLELGVKRHHIGFYHSFWDVECKRLRGDSAYTFEQISNSACNKCRKNTRCTYFNRKEEIKKPVVIIAHEGFIRLQTTDLIPDDAEIIVDEEPHAYHQKEYHPTLFTSVSAHLKQITANKPNASVDKFIKLVDDLSTLIGNSSSPSGTIQFPYKRTQLISPDTRKAVIAVIEEHEESSSCDTATEIDECSFDDYDADLSSQQLRKAVIDLSYAFAAGAKVFVAVSIYKGKTLHVARSRVDWSVGSKVILLNGSASLDRYEYPADMKVWRCPEIEPPYPNLNLYCYRCLATQPKLESKKHAQAFISYANILLG